MAGCDAVLHQTPSLDRQWDLSHWELTVLSISRRDQRDPGTGSSSAPWLQHQFILGALQSQGSFSKPSTGIEAQGSRRSPCPPAPARGWRWALRSLCLPPPQRSHMQSSGKKLDWGDRWVLQSS